MEAEALPLPCIILNTNLHILRCFFVQLLFEGFVYFIGKPAAIKLNKECMDDTARPDSWSSYSLSVLLSAMETGCGTQIALGDHRRQLFVHVFVCHVILYLRMMFICSELLNVQRLCEGSIEIQYPKSQD